MIDILIPAITGIAGLLVGMIGGHYITIKATIAGNSLIAAIKADIILIHTKIKNIENAVTAPIKKAGVALEHGWEVLETDLHTDEEDVTNIEKTVTGNIATTIKTIGNDIQTIEGKIKLI